MSERVRWDRLKRLMEQERDLLDEFGEASDALREQLHGRDWPQLESSLLKMSGLADRLQLLEKKRRSIAHRLDGESGDNLKRLAADLPPGKREEILELSRELKTRLRQIRVKTGGIGAYARSRARLGREILEELVPETRARTYDKRGQTSSPGKDAILLNHRR